MKRLTNRLLKNQDKQFNSMSAPRSNRHASDAKDFKYSF